MPRVYARRRSRSPSTSIGLRKSRMWIARRRRKRAENRLLTRAAQNRAASRRGSALLAVLWLSPVLSMIAFALASPGRGDAGRACTAVDGTRSYYLASAALQRAILYMLWGPQHAGRFYTTGSPVMN